MAGEINRRLDLILKSTDPDKLAKQAFDVFKKNTPFKTGNARSNTSLKGNEIHASYPYAGVLDKGRHMTASGARGSLQAPKGMTEPTIKFVQDTLKKELKG
jgi:hypothetical protein